MKTIIIALLLAGKVATAQVTTVDVVKVKGEYEKEAVYFYDNNWKVFREKALERKYISGFELVKSKPDTTGVLTIVLITRYPSEGLYAEAEKNFGVVMKEVAPNGPRMMNSVQRKEFIISMASYAGDSRWQKP
ncbi:MAG: hypothetical protein WDO15_15070 [Bacteroidota bacterium]